MERSFPAPFFTKSHQSDVCLPKDCDPHYLMTLCEKWRWERALTRVEHLLEVRTSDLNESEAQFRELFEMLPDVLVIYDEQGVIRHINAQGTQQTDSYKGMALAHRLEDPSRYTWHPDVHACTMPEDHQSSCPQEDYQQ